MWVVTQFLGVQALLQTKPGRCSGSRGRCYDTLKAPLMYPWQDTETPKCSHRSSDPGVDLAFVHKQLGLAPAPSL